MLMEYGIWNRFHFNTFGEGRGLISEDFVFGCYFLFAGRRACNGKGGGGSEVRGGQKSGREANTSSSGQYLVPHLSISRG